MLSKQYPIIIIYGPTAVGKTAFSEKLAAAIRGEIVNMDSAQCYTPLTIGTAKTDWRNAPVPCHLFDTLDTPEHSTVAEYRRRALAVIADIRARGKTPIFVGGSGFYLLSLLFPPQGQSADTITTHSGGWDTLKKIDPERAAQIHRNDQYRIDRALALWAKTGIKPSEYVPVFDPPEDFHIIYLTRPVDDLKERIAIRANEMLAEGFIEEVAELGGAWHSFLRDKKIIGYPEVLSYLESEQSAEDVEILKKQLIKKTTAYAKRQRTFWRMLSRKLSEVQKTLVQFNIDQFDLTLYSVDLYISQLLAKLS